MQYLVELELNLSNLDFEIPPTCPLFDSIQRLSKLRKLSLHFSGYFLPRETYPRIFTVVSSLNTLTKLNLGFGMFMLNEDEIEYFKEKFRKMDKLTDVAMKIDYDSKQPEDVDPAFMTTLGSIPLLSELQIQITNVFIPDQKIFPVIDSISSHSQLNKLRLQFWCSKLIADQTCFSVRNLLRNSINITELDLNFGQTIITDKGMVALAPALIGLTGLTNFSLNLERTSVSDKGSLPIVEALFSFPKLRNIYLNFSSCSKVTNRTGNRIIGFFSIREDITSSTLSFYSTGISLSLIHI
eukprot:TRINITY_DN5618_c0_g1_i1.p1 TRINITY_DN5618_c0_g1~~TRINITY_DN5618_c0_g1_i1.p1  ORF type:complete len:297 (+),score=24.98 TRINITY_DN5618_c0_g1_i1:844-1734(+)